MSQTILIIEDDPYVQRYFKRLFEAHEAAFEIVASGGEGINRAKELKPSLILLDIMMPVVNGFQVLAMLKSSPETKDLPVVVLSNFGDDEAIKKAKALGAVDFIVKSDTPPEELMNKIGVYIKKEEQESTNASA